MIKISILVFPLLAYSTAAFLSPTTVVRVEVPAITNPAPPLRSTSLQSDDIAKTPLACLERDYRTFKDKLRRELLQLKHKQSEVAKEEEKLLKETIQVTEFERFGQELDVASKHNELEKAHAAVEEAQANMKRAYDKMDQALDQAVLLKKSFMDSDESALQSLNLIEQATRDMKSSREIAQRSQEKEQQAIRLETGAEVLLEFLEEQEAHLKDIASSQDPQVLDEWSTEEATEHHHALLQASSMEWEYQKLRHHLQKDLLDRQHQQAQVLQEERILTAKAAELLRLKEADQVTHATEAFAEMQQANQALQEAVSKHERAYEAALWAIEEVVEMKDDIDDVDRRALELWFLEGDGEKYLDAADQAIKDAKETQVKAIKREVQAEDLLLLLTQKEQVLNDLRQPGNEKELQAWSRNEMGGAQCVVGGFRKKLAAMAINTMNVARWE